MGEARSATRDAVVRPLSRAAVRPCSRPGCPSPARATLSFAYATREAWLERLADEASPATYDLCSAHADRTRPPSGWDLRDERPVEDLVGEEPTRTRDLGGEHTVAVLAAALRAVPEAPAPEAATRDEVAVEVRDEVGDETDDAVEAVVADLAGVDELDLEDLELPDEVRADVRDALAELAAVARGEAEPAEQIAIELDDEPRSAPATAPAPRPVPAARERAGADRSAGGGHGGPARAW